MGDLHYSNVSLLVHGQGANGGTTFTDNGPLGLAVTPVGGATTSTAQFKFGTSSVLLNGTSGYLSAPTSAAFDFGSGDYTIEAWCRFSDLDVKSTIVSHWGLSGQRAFSLAFDPNAGDFTFDATPSTYAAANNYPSLNVWTHIAVSCVSGVITVYMGGVGGPPSASTGSMGTSANEIFIGAGRSNTGAGEPLAFFNGNMAEVRITKGVGRYTADFTPPTLAFDEAGVPVVSGNINLSLPSVSASFVGGGNASSALPALSAYSTGHGSVGENAAGISLPGLSVGVTTGGRADLVTPAITSALTGTVSGMAGAALALPSLSALVATTVSAMGSASIAMPSFTSVSYAGAVCSITVGSLISQATGATGASGSARVTLPLFEATLGATQQSYGGADITLPALSMGVSGRAALSLPGLQLTAIGSATITATYEAYALNLNHPPAVRGEHQVDEMTRYTNFPFTQVVRYKNSYYGVAAGALYLLEGTTDDATPIPFAVQTAKTDFGVVEKKTLTEAYFGGRLGPAETISLVVGESGTETYSYTTPRGATAQNYRQVLGKGVKARYYALGVAGDGIFELDTLDLNIDKMTRRI